MLNLSNDDRKQLRQAIEAAYPTPSDFKIFVGDELDQNLALISTAGSHRTVIFDCIQWAIARNYIDDLILALAKDNQNPQIQQFCRRVLPQSLTLNTDGVTAGTPLVLEPAAWDIDVQSESLQSFLPQQFSFQADVGTLLRGLERANAVCKITFVDRPEASGTGVLIAPDLVLTNYHVLSRKEGVDLDAIAQSARFEFGYISRKFGDAPRTQVLSAIDSKPVVKLSPIRELDYALIRLNLDPQFPIAPIPFDAVCKLQPHSSLHILQHPEGEKLKVSLSNNGVVKTNEGRGLVLYINQTKKGSSGSPCFDPDWQLVALHHKEIDTTFGSIREGILFSAIYPQIRSFL
jgi:endonuclease G, mitochondrial